MKNLDLHICEAELKKRWEVPYIWGRKQNDVWDKHSNFVYDTMHWAVIKTTAAQISLERNFPPQDFFQYTSNRWYNFWSAMALEKIFTGLEGVTAAKNSRDRLVDFTLAGIEFDLKTSNYPSGFGKVLSHARGNPKELIQWLYTNQSAQQRQHFSNRLFLVVYAEDKNHWKIKAEILWLEHLINSYVANFKEENLIKVEVRPGKTVYSDIIWAIK